MDHTHVLECYFEVIRLAIVKPIVLDAAEAFRPKKKCHKSAVFCFIGIL